MKISVWAIAVVVCLAPCVHSAESVCPRPEPGSIVEEPEDLRSQNGVLEAQLTASECRASQRLRFAIATPMQPATNRRICVCIRATWSFFI